MATSLVSLSISAKMASRLLTVTPEEVTELKEAAENLNTPKSTINWLRDFKKWCYENSFEKKKQEMILLEQLDKVLKRFYAFVLKQVDGTDMSPMLLKGNQMVFSVIIYSTWARQRALSASRKHQKQQRKKHKLGGRMIKPLLNSVIAKYRDLTVSRRSTICLSQRLRQIICSPLTNHNILLNFVQ